MRNVIKVPAVLVLGLCGMLAAQQPAPERQPPAAQTVLEADVEHGPALRRLYDYGSVAAQHADAAHHAVYVDDPRSEGPVRAAFRPGLADHAEDRPAHRLGPLLRQERQQHLLRHANWSFGT